MDDFQPFMLRILAGFIVLIVGFIVFIYLMGCGFDLACYRAQSEDIALKTPVPTLIPATLPAPAPTAPAGSSQCQVNALDLLGAWVEAGYPESQPFSFTDRTGALCQGTFAADIFPLLNENHVWYPASLSCTSCHNAALRKDSAGLDLSSYAGILAGSQRQTPEQAKGVDILAGGHWKASILYRTLTLAENIPAGHPPADYPPSERIIYAGAYAPAATTP